VPNSLYVVVFRCSARIMSFGQILYASCTDFEKSNIDSLCSDRLHYHSRRAQSIALESIDMLLSGALFIRRKQAHNRFIRSARAAARARAQGRPTDRSSAQLVRLSGYQGEQSNLPHAARGPGPCGRRFCSCFDSVLRAASDAGYAILSPEPPKRSPIVYLLRSDKPCFP
jgi:hypothetical protein